MGYVKIAGDHHLETLGNCGGFYSCPKGPNGARLGPLVGYAGKYNGPDGQKKQYVGDVYVNFAKAEIHPNVLMFFARCLATKLNKEIQTFNINTFCGAPIGGYALATTLSIITDISAIKAEKKVTALATETSREKSKLFFGRHEIESGKDYVIVEDVCNNFSTSEELIALIKSAGGNVIAIACFLNRSLTVDHFYHSLTASCEIPVVSLVRLQINQWQQDNPDVVKDIEKGNVIWKPKDEWGSLAEVMQSVS